jgi:hypothetical protein
VLGKPDRLLGSRILLCDYSHLGRNKGAGRKSPRHAPSYGGGAPNCQGIRAESGPYEATARTRLGGASLVLPIGFMFDTTLAFARMIFAGFIDTYPQRETHRRAWRRDALSGRPPR